MRHGLKLIVASILFQASLANCAEIAWAEDAASKTSFTEDQLRRSDWIAAGEEQFNSVCTYCHGSRGEGGKVKSFTERKGWNPQVIHDTITNGRIRGSNVMPPWGGSISDADIWKLVAYIKSLSLDFKGPLPPPTGNP